MSRSALGGFFRNFDFLRKWKSFEKRGDDLICHRLVPDVVGCFDVIENVGYALFVEKTK